MAAPRLALAVAAVATAVLLAGCSGDRPTDGAVDASATAASSGTDEPAAGSADGPGDAVPQAEVAGPAGEPAAAADEPSAPPEQDRQVPELDRLREAAAVAQGPAAGPVKATAARAAAERSSFDRDLAVQRAGAVVVSVRAVDEALRSSGDAAAAMVQLRERYVDLGDAGTPVGVDREEYASTLQRLVLETSRAADDMASRPDAAVETWSGVRQGTARLLDQVGAAVGTAFRLG